MSELRDVIRRYHEKMHPDHLGFTADTLPTELLAFRRRLHDEEVREVREAWDSLDHFDHIRAALTDRVRAEFDRDNDERDERLAHLLHELADVVIVAFGTSEYHDMNFDDVLNAVMRANMRKIPPKMPGGKATKPAGWIPADETIVELIRAARRRQQAAADPFEHNVTAHRSVRPYVSDGFGPVVVAQFDSICNACDDEIDEGDPIRVGPTGAVHKECADDVNADIDPCYCSGLSHHPRCPKHVLPL